MHKTQNTQSLLANQLVQALGADVIKVIGDLDRLVVYPAAIQEAENSEALTFCNVTGDDAIIMIRHTAAGVILCKPEISLGEFTDQNHKTFIIVDSPRLAFIRLVHSFFSEPLPRGMHPTAVIDPRAKIDPDTYIGPFTSIGNCEVGKGTIIYGHVHIYSNVQIGQNVIIHAGTVIGSDGFGYQRNEAGRLEKFPHIGGVIIDDNVEIGSNTSIDRGTLGDTIIREGAKIDNLVHIAHNVVIGRHSVIIAHAMIGGSTEIGDFAWVAPSACIRDGIKVGDHSTIGLGAVVVKDVPPQLTVMGVPARSVESYKALLKQLETLIK